MCTEKCLELTREAAAQRAGARASRRAALVGGAVVIDIADRAASNPDTVVPWTTCGPSSAGTAASRGTPPS